MNKTQSAPRNIWQASLRWLLVAAVAGGAALVRTPLGTARGASLVVNSTADAVDAHPGDGVCASALGQCTLRAAIMEANALAGDDAVIVPEGVFTLALPGTLENGSLQGDLDITSNLRLSGAGAGKTILEAGRLDRVLEISAASDPLAVMVSDLTLQGGVADSGGGVAIRSNVTLRLERCALRQNAATGLGGGLINHGVLTVLESVISDNSALRGGGLYNDGVMTVSNSLISHNTAVIEGGGVEDFGGPSTILHSTIADNAAPAVGGGVTHSSTQTLTINASTIARNTTNGPGGGIFNNAVDVAQPLNIINSTIFGNSAGNSGGVAVDAGPVTFINSTVVGNSAAQRGGGIGYAGGLNEIRLVNTILALNRAPAGADCVVAGTSLGHNLVGNPAGCLIVLQPTDKTGEPGLLTFTDDGAPGNGYLPLRPDSPALEAGDDGACPAQDQRGVARPQGRHCDVGAYELETPPLNFPATAVVDDFDRAMGLLRSNWYGPEGLGGYAIYKNRVRVLGGGPIYWRTASAFGVNQEAFITLVTVDGRAQEQDLLLKVQGGSQPDWRKGAIEILVDSRAGQVRVETFRPGNVTWARYPGVPISFSWGDQLGGRALANGRVLIYRNGVLIHTVTLNAADQGFFNSAGGSLGLWFINASYTWIDNFGGGTIAP